MKQASAVTPAKAEQESMYAEAETGRQDSCRGVLLLASFARLRADRFRFLRLNGYGSQLVENQSVAKRPIGVWLYRGAKLLATAPTRHKT